ncbi:MAG: TMEM14 family protein [Fimbriimonadaceae bacterium]|nr:TMEM14 family protein [Fimbriimonadaceae bacterium]
MPWLNGVLYGYALVNLAVGLQAFLGEKHSTISLVAGGGAAVLTVLGVWLAQRNTLGGYGLCALVTILLIGRFLPVFLKDSSKLYPAALIAGLSLAVLACLVIGHFAAPSRSAPSAKAETRQ